MDSFLIPFLKCKHKAMTAAAPAAAPAAVAIADE